MSYVPGNKNFTEKYKTLRTLFMHLPTVLWAWICAPATHFLGARILITLIFYSSCGPNKHPATTLAFPPLCNCTVLPTSLSTGPIWIQDIEHMVGVGHFLNMYKTQTNCRNPPGKVELHQKIINPNIVSHQTSGQQRQFKHLPFPRRWIV